LLLLHLRLGRLLLVVGGGLRQFDLALLLLVEAEIFQQQDVLLAAQRFGQLLDLRPDAIGGEG
jgi:hypothetical protein